MIRTTTRVAGLSLLVVDLYLVGLLVAAARPRVRRGVADEDADPPRTRDLAVADEAVDRPGTRFLVLVPAHDEALAIERCVASLVRSAYPRKAFRVVVVADNCTDATASLAAAAGATVLERHAAGERGKGHALNWALDRAGALAFEHDAVAFVDADCEASPDLLAALDAALAAGAPAVQAAYVVSNPEASSATALRSAAFSLMNYVRPLGRTRLGMSAGLLGTGMAFRAPLVQALRFDTASGVEDADLHLRLVERGHRVAFAPGAQVRSPMPTSAGAIESQQARWEGGRWALIRRFERGLLAEGVRRRDPARLGAAFDLLVPPLTILSLLHVVSGGLSSALGRRPGRVLALLTVGLHAGFVLGGLRLAGTPASTYRALAGVPSLVVQKVRLLSGLAARGAPKTWERTAREPDAAITGPAASARA